MDAETLVLASASPRRRELLQQIGVRFRVQAADIDETPQPKESAQDLVQRLACGKALAVQQALAVQHQHPVILAADTVVSCTGTVLGKPRHGADAARMLGLLSGNSHEVCSAVVVCHRNRLATRLSVSTVSFRELSAAEIDAYWASGEPQGKAGSYAIQGIGGMFVSHLTGSYSGVVGLPLCETAELLTEFGVAHALRPARPR